MYKELDASVAPGQAEARLQRGLSIIKLLYFFFYAGLGVFIAFLNVYYQSIGLSGTQIGLINTFGPLVGIFGTTLWGMVSDRFGKIRLLLVFASLGVILAVTGLSAAQTFLWILLIACFFSLFHSAIFPLLDSTTLSLLGDRRERYGYYRVWGTIGFIVTSLLAGLVYQRFGLRVMFPAYTVVILAFLVASLGLPNQPIRLGGSLLYGMNQMIRKSAWIIFAASVLLLWVAASGTMAFLSITIKAMGGGEVLIGMAWTIAALVEAPVILLSGALLHRFGAARLLGISFIGYTLRTLLYALMPSPNWVLGINLLHCVSYVPFWIGAVAYANDLAPDNLKATSQGMLFSIMSLASVGGAMLSGLLYDSIGPPGLFKVLTGFCCAALLLFWTGRFTLSSGGGA